MKQYLQFFLITLYFITLNLAAEVKTTEKDPRIIPITTIPPKEGHLYPIAIIGAGAAGTMAVNRSVLNNDETLLFAGTNQDRRRSRGSWVKTVDNVPGLGKYTRAIFELRNETLQELMKTPLAHNLFVIEDSILFIEKNANFFKLTDSSGRVYHVKHVILATGMMDEQPHINGSIRPILKYANAQTVAYCSLCDGHRCVNKKTVVIGHSESAGSIALLLAEKYTPTSITILTNGRPNEFSQELLKKLVGKNIQICEDPMTDILSNSNQLTGFKLQNGTNIEAEMGFVALGVRPNNQLALQLGAGVDASGLVISDPKGETSIPNLFVIGDLRAGSLKQIYSAWQGAVESVQLINRRIREDANNSGLNLDFPF